MSDITRLMSPCEIPLANAARHENSIMYVDLNSCFATIEQQARPMLRGRPVAITNRITKNACIVAASYEAKALGIKVGMRRMEAEAICPDLIFAETEPAKFIYVHQKLRRIMQDYYSDVIMKSIDEGIIDLTKRPLDQASRSPLDIGTEIKQRLRTEIGCHMRCNIGIASNRFLAKTAAELHKPDGMDEITSANQRQIFASLKLMDLPGINTRMQARLNAVNIFTPTDLINAKESTLVKLVCKSIDGSKWYRRLRGIEVDDTVSDIKSIGRQYVLESCHLSKQELEARILHLAEDLGHRLRSQNLYARGLFVWIGTHSDLYLHQNYLTRSAFHTNSDIMTHARQLFTKLPLHSARIIGITLYKIQPFADAQLYLDQPKRDREEQLCAAEDKINRRFGERTICSADSFNTSQIKTKIPFGSTRFLDIL